MFCILMFFFCFCCFLISCFIVVCSDFDLNDFNGYDDEVDGGFLVRKGFMVVLGMG